MNKDTLAALTEALDTALVSTANAQLEKLSSGLSDQEIAVKIHSSLDSLSKLQRGVMPEYNEWDALFYSLWYQPGHVNLAYTLARKIPEDRNPLLTGRGSLRIVDFGCGALAMQFGLALAATGTLRRYQNLVPITILSEDSSEPMKNLGWMLWYSFMGEIEKYSELDALRRVCDEMRFDDQDGSPNVCWLTALHVAYEENASDVRKNLADIIRKQHPDVVLVTTHEGSAAYAFSAKAYGYSNNSEVFLGTGFELRGEFNATTRFRSNLYNNKIGFKPNLLNPDDKDFVRNYLKSYHTAWTTPGFETSDFLYIRN